MHLSVRLKRWLGLILIVFLAAAGIQLGYAQGYASPHPGMRGETAGAVVRDTVRVMETQGQAETPGCRSLPGAAKSECALLFTARDAHLLRIPYEKVTGFGGPVLAGRRLLMDWNRYYERPRAVNSNECAGQSGTYRDFFPDCYYARKYSGAFTRIFLPSCRIENLYVRSHVLMIAYIHCQDGAKGSGLL